jgi:hypothetical protein
MTGLLNNYSTQKLHFFQLVNLLENLNAQPELAHQEFDDAAFYSRNRYNQFDNFKMGRFDRNTNIFIRLAMSKNRLL